MSMMNLAGALCDVTLTCDLNWQLHLRSEDRRAKKLNPPKQLARWWQGALTTTTVAITVAYYTNNPFQLLSRANPYSHTTLHHITPNHHHVPQEIRSEHAGCGQAVIRCACQNPARRLRLPAVHSRRVAKIIRHEDVLGCSRIRGKEG